MNVNAQNVIRVIDTEKDQDGKYDSWAGRYYAHVVMRCHDDWVEINQTTYNRLRSKLNGKRINHSVPQGA